eukprot:TRINITY_DN22144_c0_g1_i1.p1 TRINITY_DN22144_c0_g1~~TRINITY_DN22144_c0_g1_i1.p1  ORF type:complete len:205 (-),score=61.67 TRINITY_DN22144_c0_g1_i1:66-644(-)
MEIRKHDNPNSDVLNHLDNASNIITVNGTPLCYGGSDRNNQVTLLIDGEFREETIQGDEIIPCWMSALATFQQADFIGFGGIGRRENYSDIFVLQLTDDLQVINITEDFAVQGDIPAARYGCTLTRINQEDRWLMFGGETDEGFTDELHLLTFEQDNSFTWEQVEVKSKEKPGARCIAVSPVTEINLTSHML